MKTQLTAFILLISNIFFSQKFENNVYEYISSNKNVSYASIDLSIKSSQIEDLLRREFSKNILDGETPKLGYLLHGDESITIEKIERVLVTPAKEAYNEVKRIPKTFTRSVKVGTKAYKCYLKPWKWKKCWKDVFQDVTETTIEEVTVRIPAVAAVYKDIAVPFIQIQQSIVPIKGKFSYDIKLDDIGIQFEGNKYKIVTFFDAGVRTHVELDGLPSFIKPKGNFNSSFKFKIAQEGFVEIKKDGTIEISNPKTEFSIVEALGSDFIVNTIENGSKIVQPSYYLLEYFGKITDQKLNEIVKSELKKNSSKINIRERAEELISQFDKPVNVYNVGKFYPNITGIFVSQINGMQLDQNNVLNLKMGITFQPFITFQENSVELPVKDTIVQFSTEIKESSKINISLPVFLDYSFIANESRPYIDDFNEGNKNKFILKKYLVANPEASFSESNGNIAVFADLLKRRNGKKIGRISIESKIYSVQQDTSIKLSVSKIKVRSSNLLINLAKPLIKKKIKQEAEKESNKNRSKDILKASKMLNKLMKINTPFGEIQGVTENLNITDVIPFEKFVLVKINLSGKTKFIEN